MNAESAEPGRIRTTIIPPEAADYPDKWIAIKGHEIIAHADTYDELMAAETVDEMAAVGFNRDSRRMFFPAWHEVHRD